MKNYLISSNRNEETNLQIIASKNVKAGIRSDSTEAKVGELYPIPLYIHSWTLDLQIYKPTHNQTHITANPILLKIDTKIER